jgi:transcriptional regulator with GAF, ATPase, and Fis domain
MSAQTSWITEAPPVNPTLDHSDSLDTGLPGIVGTSAALRNVLNMVRVVAPTDATVVINGETGTGKELIAEAIHKCSRRAKGPFVKINCAAIPAGLLESELFGHERGAYTGAVTRGIGRFERANRGTLFLDEIGDLPLELQPKLLRVMQEKEFERLGGTGTIHTDVRVICATHRNLGEMINRREFRADLFYRLGVFPIELPPLRERREDIPDLVTHFVEIFGRRISKQIEQIPPDTMAALDSYEWPGNIRELQNLIERAVILSDDGVLRNPLPSNNQQTVTPNPLPANNQQSVTATLNEGVRALILQALEEAGWMIGGPEGAAVKLGLKRTSLIYKMKKLGIVRVITRGRGRELR